MRYMPSSNYYGIHYRMQYIYDYLRLPVEVSRIHSTVLIRFFPDANKNVTNSGLT